MSFAVIVEDYAPRSNLPEYRGETETQRNGEPRVLCRERKSIAGLQHRYRYLTGSWADRR